MGLSITTASVSSCSNDREIHTICINKVVLTAKWWPHKCNETYNFIHEFHSLGLVINCIWWMVLALLCNWSLWVSRTLAEFACYFDDCCCCNAKCSNKSNSNQRKPRKPTYVEMKSQIIYIHTHKQLSCSPYNIADSGWSPQPRSTTLHSFKCPSTFIFYHFSCTLTFLIAIVMALPLNMHG